MVLRWLVGEVTFTSTEATHNYAHNHRLCPFGSSATFTKLQRQVAAPSAHGTSEEFNGCIHSAAVRKLTYYSSC